MKLISKSLVAFVLVVVGAVLAGRPVWAHNMAGSSMPMHGKSMSANATSKIASKSYSVEIKDFAFAPATITVPVGAKITWVNKDEEPHTVVSTDNAFKSKALDTDEQFSFTFAKPGTYKYFCSVHPKMVATVVVEGPMKKHSMKMGKMN
ncbi:MAG: cupredoxin domain-containing protein [Candidatus Acidiferrales bacterium]